MVIIMFFIQAELSVIPFDLRCKACQQPVSRPCLIDWPGTGCESCRAKGELCDLEDSESESVSSSKSVSDANVIPPCSYLMSIAVMILIISLRLFSCCCSLVFVLSSHTISWMLIIGLEYSRQSSTEPPYCFSCSRKSFDYIHSGCTSWSWTKPSSCSEKGSFNVFFYISSHKIVIFVSTGQTACEKEGDKKIDSSC